MTKTGTVYLVGAGPGDPGLLTLRGAELLRRADVVIYDMLVNPELLRLAPPVAELISRGKRQDVSQDELNDLMIARAREGRCVVRLKGGDPYIFGRGGEEAEALVAAKVPFEVVPGVSSITAAPNYAGIPLTHRDHTSNFTVFTGHEGEGKTTSSLDFDQIARTSGTKVILMGVTHLRELTQALLDRGVAKETPVAIVQWGTWGRQKSIEGTLATIEALAKKEHITPPALTVIGDVVKLRKKLNWFENRPLFGQRIVVTRSRKQAQELSKKFADLGADVVEIPTIKQTLPSSIDDLKDALLELNTYEWLVFTSANGVSAFFDLFFKAHKDTRDIGGARIAAVGPGTAARLQELHLQVDLMPEEALGSKIAAEFAKYQNIENVSMCLFRAEKANPDLPRELEKLGAIVDDIACYQTVAESEDTEGNGDGLLEHGADWLTFTSGSTVEHFHARFDLPALLKKFPQMKIASIGPETSKALKAIDVEPTIEAKQHTMDGLVAALLKAARRGS
ncbi:MAG TPA: uroporphyrinogen-III C-methyltransferase [Verrucomicrobiota bacterium]|nr:uroporphyrinogen-III C-methyltransferase [Verrucomicrobiota bacterium]